VIDAENGNTATKLAAMLQQIKATTGIDAPKLLSQWNEDCR
jgi:hypothetical protein